MSEPIKQKAYLIQHTINSFNKLKELVVEESDEFYDNIIISFPNDDAVITYNWGGRYGYVLYITSNSLCWVGDCNTCDPYGFGIFKGLHTYCGEEYGDEQYDVFVKILKTKQKKLKQKTAKLKKYIERLDKNI